MENLKLKVKLSAYSKGVIPKKLTDLENDGDFVQDPNYVHTDNNYTNEDKERLSHYDKETVLNGAVRYDINQTLTEQERNRVKDALQIPQDIEQFQGRVEDLEAFQGVQEGINQGNDIRFGTIEGDISSLEGNIGSLEGQIEVLEGDISSLEQDIEDLQTDKLDKNLGAENKGKILSIKNDGDIIPVEFPEVVFPDNKTITKNSEGELQAKALIRSDGSLITVENINDLQLDVAEYKYNNNNRVQAVENKNITQQTEIDYVTKKVNTLKGAGGYLNSADFGDLSDKDQEYIRLHLNSYALTEIGITDYLDIWNGTKVKNKYDGHTWILTNTQDTIPAVFEWTDQGIDYVALATDISAGIVKGTTDQFKVSVDMIGEMSVNGLEEALDNIVVKTDDVTIGLDSIGELSLKIKRLGSGKDVLNVTTSDNIAYEFTSDEGIDTSKTVREVLDTKEESFTKNTAFNKDFDVTSGGGESTTVVGNLDTRLTDARSASDVYAWAKNPTLLESDVPELSATKITSGKLQGVLVEDNYFVEVGDIEDSLTSVATDKALSANQGRVLNEKVENIKLKFIVEEGF